MKVSVSLPEDYVTFIDEVASRTGAGSRSSVLREAIELLRMAELEDAYASAWDEWSATDDAQHWESTVPDGIADAAR